MKRLLTLLAVAVALSGLAAPAPKKDPVASGFIDWQMQGVQDPKRRQLLPSELRHRYVVIVEFQGEKIYEQMKLGARFIQYMPPPTGGMNRNIANWYGFEYPRNAIFAFSNCGGKIPADQLEKLETGKFTMNDDPGLFLFKMSDVPLVENLGFEGSPNTEGKYPYLYIMGPEGREPIYKGVISSQADVLAADKAFKAALAAGQGNWTRFYGSVSDPKAFKAQMAKAIKSGKGFATVLPLLKKGIASKNEETAREAQTIYDAIIQDRCDLAARIRYESSDAPVMAMVDFREFSKLYPQDKKSVEGYLAKASAVSEFAELADMFEKPRLWESSEFLCKNAGEVKKNVQQLTKYKKRLEQLIAEANDTTKRKNYNTALQNCLFVLQPRVEALIVEMPHKQKQK